MLTCGNFRLEAGGSWGFRPRVCSWEQPPSMCEGAGGSIPGGLHVDSAVVLAAPGPS